MYEVIYEGNISENMQAYKGKIEKFLSEMLKRVFSDKCNRLKVICSVSSEIDSVLFHLKAILHSFGTFVVDRTYMVSEYLIEEIKTN